MLPIHIGFVCLQFMFKFSFLLRIIFMNSLSPILLYKFNITNSFLRINLRIQKYSKKFMVPGPSFNAVRLPTIASKCFRSVDTTILPREAPAETSDSGCVVAVCTFLSKFSLPSRVSEIVISSWRSSTQAQYGSAWAKWSSWYVQWQEDPISCNFNCFLEFLAELFDAGLQYRTINVYRSAISVLHLPVDGCLLGSHPLVTRFMEGVH